MEVDESAFWWSSAGKRGHGAAGRVMVAIAVERCEPAGFGRCRLAIIPNANGPALREFLLANVEPGATIITDGLSSCPSAVGSDYAHDPFNVSASGLPAHIPLPGVHRVAALVKRWLLGTHQGAVEGDHLQAYLDEFAFRFNRRTSAARGMIVLPTPRTIGRQRARPSRRSRRPRQARINPTRPTGALSSRTRQSRHPAPSPPQAQLISYCTQTDTPFWQNADLDQA